MLESQCVTVQSSSNDSILGTLVLHCKKLLGESFVLDGTRHQSFGKHHFEEPIEVGLEKDDEAELFNVNVAKLFLKEEKDAVEPSLKGEAEAENQVQLLDLKRS